MGIADIEAWATRELAAWQHSTLDAAVVERGLRALAAGHPGICLYRIADGDVAFDPSVAETHPHCLDPAQPLGQRAGAYLRLLRDAVRIFGVAGQGLVGMHLNDLYLENIEVPLCFFQKPMGARGVLLPDIDFLITNHYADDGDEFYDRYEWSQKTPRAVFVGSTTGELTLTADAVRRGRSARLRAAQFFHTVGNVDFDLPNVVQYDTPETLALIESLPMGRQRRTWDEQQRYRYILSMDGNGATCSRVAIALAGQSVLVKYHSPNILYYFHGMEAWRHYIPVRSSGEVKRLLRGAAPFDGLHRAIAAEGRAFAHANLSRMGVLRYTATLLARYLAAFGHGGGAMRAPDTARLIDSLAHVSGIGTIWTDPGDEAGRDAPIEGYRLVPGPDIGADGIAYQGLWADGTATGWRPGRRYCGTRDAARALHGMAVRLEGEVADRLRLAGEMRFADGARFAIPEAPGTPHPAPLVGFRLSVTPR